MEYDESSFASVLRYIGEMYLTYPELVELRRRLIQAQDWQRAQLEAGVVGAVVPVNFLALGALDSLNAGESITVLMGCSNEDLLVMAKEAQGRSLRPVRRGRKRIKE